MSARFPKVAVASYVVLCVEGTTGIVLGLSGQRAVGEEDQYRSFVDRRTASEWAHAAVSANPLLECVVYDHAGNALEVEKNVEALMQAAKAGARKPWRRRLVALFTR